MLPLALSDLKIGSNGWVGVQPQLLPVLLHETFAMLQESQLVIEMVLLVLGCYKTYSPHHFRIVLVVAEWQRMSGLLFRICLSACKTLQSIRRSSASIGQFHTSDRDEGLSRISSCTPFSGNLLLVCPLLLRSTMTSTQVRRLLDGEVGDHQDIVSLSPYNFRVASVVTRPVPQSQ